MNSKNILDLLVELLMEDDQFVSDGKLLRNKIIESALALDSKLIKLLIKNTEIKNLFFIEVDNILVFDKVKFQRFINNKQFLPDSYTEFKNKIGLAVEDNFISDSKEVVLSWPYKDCVLEGGQDKEDTKRDEIFWNNTLAPEQIDRLLAPKTLVNFKFYDKEGDRNVLTEDITDNSNLIIKGNNLLALHSLKLRYSEKIKLIYIDPPYNPDSKANTFCYNNRFNRSTWLTFIKNRIDVAKKLLTPDGVLIVAIDEEEQAHLGVFLKETFPEHEVHCITVVHNPRGVQGTNFSYTHEYAFFVIPRNKKSIGSRKIEDDDITWRNLRDNGGESLRSDAKNCFYGIIVEDGEITGFTDVVPNEINPESQIVKNGNQSIIYPIDSEGIQRKWRYARQSVEEIKNLLRAKKTKNGFEIELGKDFGTYRTVWQDPRYDANEYGTKLIKSLVPDCKFDFPKSLWNVYDCLYAVVGEDKNAVILDFFGGSGTTAHAVLELNKKDNGQRKFIITEQMYYIETVTVPRVHQVIKNNKEGSFVYCELAKSNEIFADKIEDAKTKQDIKNIYEEMVNEAFLSYQLDLKALEANKTDFDLLEINVQKAVLMEMLDKNLLYVPLSEMGDQTYKIDKNDQKLNQIFYKIEN